VAISLATLRIKILNILQKETNYQGFYTVDKINQAVNESMDYVAARAMHEAGNGWFEAIVYVTTTTNTPNYTIPADTALIREVRYKQGNDYFPLSPIEAVDEIWAANSSQVQLPWRYELIGNEIIFNPIPSAVGVNFLQFKVMKFPTALTLDADLLNGQFSRALEWFIIYRAASALVQAVGNASPEWYQREVEWYKVMESMLTNRIKKPKFIRDFRF
jgi:hypothetical protein